VYGDTHTDVRTSWYAVCLPGSKKGVGYLWWCRIKWGNNAYYTTGVIY